MVAVPRQHILSLESIRAGVLTKELRQVANGQTLCASCHTVFSGGTNPSFPTRFNSQLVLLSVMESLEAEGKTGACIFCSKRISFGQSACTDCMKKYNIRPFDLGTDGCGCDK